MKKKMMTHFVSAMIFLFAGLFVSAQDMTMDDVKLVQQAFGRDKKVLLGEYLKMDSVQSAKFWPIYDAYEEERRKLGRDRIMVIDDYAKNYDKLTNEKADELVKKIMNNDEAFVKLQKKYYEHVKKATTPLVGAQFMQFEHYIQTSIRSEIQEAIPFIGEIKKQAPKG